MELKGIVKTYEENGNVEYIIKDISMTVGKGEFVSIIGPSGCGKSTLFHIIGGLTEPTAGQVWMEGKEVTGQKGLISYMPQDHALFPWRTIAENVIIAQEVAGVPIKAAMVQAREWLVKVGLAGYENAYPHILSGGMQQRAAFLRALLSPQEFMCLDEPFGSLDALTRMDMQQWLLSIWEQNKRSVLFITHSIEEALYLSDRIYLLSNSPASVIREIHVPFSRPRLEEHMNDPVFHALKQEIYAAMKGEQTNEKH
ncbi:MAG: transporter ATP-binding protein [Bacilli bacterium]|nr:transporter ATP-binding protein [Bacilli bacterium]